MDWNGQHYISAALFPPPPPGKENRYPMNRGRVAPEPERTFRRKFSCSCRHSNTGPSSP